jgi:hypothetical protein
MVVLPIVLSAPPYSLSEALIGVANGVPFGVGGLLAAPLGGAMADWGARRWAAAPPGRMVFGTAAALCIFPLAVSLFGWGMHFRLPAAAPLVGGCVGGRAGGRGAGLQPALHGTASWPSLAVC